MEGRVMGYGVRVMGNGIRVMVKGLWYKGNCVTVMV
jgi:hypothetical protein